jgi:hypothetical protein
MYSTAPKGTIGMDFSSFVGNHSLHSFALNFDRTDDGPVGTIEWEKRYVPDPG